MKNYRILCLAVAAVFALSACGSSGGGGGVNIGGNQGGGNQGGGNQGGGNQGGGNQGGGQASHVNSLPVDAYGSNILGGHLHHQGLLSGFSNIDAKSIEVTLPGGSSGKVEDGGSIDISSVPTGSVQKLPFTQYLADGSEFSTGQLHILRRAYSVVVRQDITRKEDGFRADRPVPIEGRTTRRADVPTGQLRYQGTAFTAGRQGTFNYNISADRKGSGSITGFGGTAVLRETQMQNTFFTGEVTHNGNGGGSYYLQLFGPHAEEIAGHAYHRDFETDRQIGLSGTKQ